MIGPITLRIGWFIVSNKGVESIELETAQNLKRLKTIQKPVVE